MNPALEDTYAAPANEEPPQTDALDQGKRYPDRHEQFIQVGY